LLVEKSYIYNFLDDLSERGLKPWGRWREPCSCRQHSTDLLYCPFCFDPWEENSLRPGVEQIRVPMPILCDGLYNCLQENQKHSVERNPLCNAVRASHLLDSIKDPMCELVRPTDTEPEMKFEYLV